LNAFSISEVNMGIMNTSPIMEIVIQKALSRFTLYLF